MDSQTLKERYDLKAQFLKEFPLDSLKTMPIEKYTNLIYTPMGNKR